MPSDPPGTPVRYALPILVAALLASVVATPGATRAQTPTPASTDEPSLRFVAGPLWHEPGDRLALRLRIGNPSTQTLEGFRIIVGIEDRVLNRSTLENAFRTDTGVPSSALPLEFSEDVPAGSSTTVTLSEPLSSFPTLAGASEGGVYPAILTLQDASGLQIYGSVKVPLVFYPRDPETALNIVLVLPLNERPTRSPGGSFLTEDGVTALESGLDDGGWLTAYMSALEEVAVQTGTAREPPRRQRGNSRRQSEPPPSPLHVTLGIAPRTIEELSDMSDGYQTDEDETVAADSQEAVRAGRALDNLAALLQEDNVQHTLIPYAFPDLPAIVRELPIDHSLDQLNEARSLARRELNVGPQNEWLFPPAGRLDEASLEQVQRVGLGNSTFFSHDSLVQPQDLQEGGCPQFSPSFTCAVRVETAQGISQGFVTDPGLSDRLSALVARNEDRLSLQQFFAETAMIREELPGTEDRVVQVTVPSLWRPSPRNANFLMKGLRDAPWLRDVTAEEALAELEPVERRVVEEARRLVVEPDPSFFDDVVRAAEVIDSYQASVPPDSQRLARLRRNLLASQSRTLWRKLESAQDFLSASRREAESELGKIDLAGAEDLACTSRTCRIQLVLTNEATYPMQVMISLESPGLDLRRSRVDEIFDPGSHPLAFDATVRGSGVFTLAVRMTSADGEFLIQEKQIVIRSTNFNRIALGITVGALAFLVLFFFLRTLRRRPKATGE